MGLPMSMTIKLDEVLIGNDAVIFGYRKVCLEDLERGVVGFVIRLGRLRGWLVRLPLMLLPPSTRPTSTYLGIAILCQKRDRHNCDDEFCHRGLDALGR